MARFDEDNFQITYRYEGQSEDDISLVRWTITQPFPVPAYGPAGGRFIAEIVQRRDGRWEKWRFLPRVAMIHLEQFQTETPEYDEYGNIVKVDIATERFDFTEPMESLAISRSFGAAIASIKDYVRDKVNGRAWVGHEGDTWWE